MHDSFACTWCYVLQLSFTYQNQEEDNSSVSTKAGDGEEAQLQMSILSAKDENEPSIRKTG